jgi:pyruvate-formate lyase
MMRELSPRVKLLQQRFEQRYAELGTRLYAEPDEAALAGRILLGVYHDTVGQPVILRRAAALQAFAAEYPVQVEPFELLVGRQTFNPPSVAREHPSEALEQLGYAATTGHIVHHYEALLLKGVNGLRRELLVARRGVQSAEAALTAIAFERALEAFSQFIHRHADAAERLAGGFIAGRAAEWWSRAGDLLIIGEHPAQSFAQALQLVWFAQIFLHVENPSMAISFGRLDQYLWPFLRRDLFDKRLTEDQAFELVCAFCLKCCEGEESQNVTLGGVDADGHDAANPLSVMFVVAMEALRCHQPSLTVPWLPFAEEGERLEAAADRMSADPAAAALPPPSPDTPWAPGTPDTPVGPALMDAACRLAASGLGQPGFMNDAVVTSALQAVDVPLDRARDWAIIGCYEAAPQGDCYPNTVLGGLHLPQALDEYLEQPEALNFDSFLAGFHVHLQAGYQAELQRLQRTWNHLRDHAPSPFGSLLMDRCLERLTPLEAGGASYNLVGIDIEGLGTLVDSLHAIRTLVYQQQELTLEELAAAVRANFPDEALRMRLLNLPGRYGTDSPATNHLAAAVSERIARMVLDSRLAHGVRPYPAFFRFGGDIHDLRVASPDGRRKADFISYGAGPSAAVPTTPTAVLRSASHVAHRLCACGNPLAISLPQPPLPPEEASRLIRELVDTYFGMGGMHVHFNTPSSADLREAQRQPGEHENLMIRVSGFSARFVRMDEQWQEALIERAEQGL